MLKIRLRRMGSRHRPFYRIVVSDSRRTPTASALEELGYYDPRQKAEMLEVDLERFDYWLSNGAQPSSTVARLAELVRSGAKAAPAADEAPAESERKAKTEKQAKAEEAPAEKAEATPEKDEQEATAKAEEAPAEEAAAEADKTAEPEKAAEES